jgi:hypothetical protein
MASLIIHIGSHKTGTTAVQRACFRHLNEATSYINIRPTGTRIIKSSGQLENFRAWIDLDAVDQLFRPNQEEMRFITSDEEFFWIYEPDSVERFAALLRQRYDSITVLCYLRRQDRLAVSHRKQVSEGNTPAARFYGVMATPLPEYAMHLDRYFDYNEKLSEIWAKAFGRQNITVVPYDRKTLVGGDIVEDFAHRCGLQFNLTEPIRVNSSLDGNRTFLGLKLSELKIARPRRKKIIDRLPGSGTFVPARAEAQAFLAHFAEANERLARNWQFEGAPFRFDRDFTFYPESRSLWSTESVEQILQAVLLGGAGQNEKM